MVAGEDGGPLSEQFRDGVGGAPGLDGPGLLPTAITTRVGAPVTASASGRWSLIAQDRSESSGSSRDPSSSVGIPNAAGSGAGCAKYASVNSPSQEVMATKAAIPAPTPAARTPPGRRPGPGRRRGRPG